MKLLITKRTLKIVALTIWGLCTLLLAYLAAVCYVKANFGLKLQPTQALAPSLEHQLNQIENGLQNGSIPFRIIDHRSKGFPEDEAKLLEMRRAMDIFQITFRQNPTDSEDILRLGTIPNISSKDKDAFTRIAKACSLFNLEKDSYILNCDRWSPSNSDEIRGYVQSFEPRTEKFYVVRDHVVLFVPAPAPG